MRKKYYPVDISKLLSHKMICKNVEELMSDIDNIGVMGVAIIDERCHFKHVEKYLKGIRYSLYGSESEFDNFICDGQVLLLGEKRYYKQLAILGYNEFFSFKTEVQAGCDDDIQGYDAHFYHMTENLSALFKNEVSENSFKASTFHTNMWQSVNYFCDVIDINREIDRIVFPVNIETHIAAITLIC